jgi:DNA-binding XRE family transcriptional regulator
LTAQHFFDILFLKEVSKLKDRIKQIRKEAGLTQEKFAERLGLKRQTIATYETGRSEPMDTIIFSICREFNINENWLRYGTEPMKINNVEFGSVCREIGVKDPKARQAILDYWELSPEDKELWWKFVERFMN